MNISTEWTVLPSPADVADAALEIIIRCGPDCDR